MARGQMAWEQATTKVLPKSNMSDFIGVLTEFGEVHGPVKTGESSYAFQPVLDPDQIDLTYLRTILPLKKYLFKPEEDLYSFTAHSGFEPEYEDLQRKTVLLGVHPCDINSIKLLDRIFDGKYSDPRYFRRQSKLLVIGTDCMPDDKCFCHAQGTSSVDNGYDLFLTDIGDLYFVHVGTPAGEDIVSKCKSCLKSVEKPHVDAFRRRLVDRSRAFDPDVVTRDIPPLFELEYDSEIWNELGERCLSCGSCSLVCPTCYCYDVVDTVGLDGASGKRTRKWDACTLVDFARVAGGHNFRETSADRIKWRYYHKHVGFIEQYGRSGCMGCGRCIEACPAKIDVREVIDQLRRGKVMENVG